jgi:hypothetical protein
MANGARDQRQRQDHPPALAGLGNEIVERRHAATLKLQSARGYSPSRAGGIRRKSQADRRSTGALADALDTRRAGYDPGMKTILLLAL